MVFFHPVIINIHSPYTVLFEKDSSLCDVLFCKKTLNYLNSYPLSMPFSPLPLGDGVIYIIGKFRNN